MSIIYDEKRKMFNLKSADTSYVFGLLDDKYLVHIHWGGRIDNLADFDQMLPRYRRGYTALQVGETTTEKSLDTMTMEYPTFGNVDLRIPAFHAQYEDGSRITKLSYESHKIVKGKPELSGLPHTYIENENEAETLEIKLTDEKTGLIVYLVYTLFEESGVITRNVRCVNGGNEKIVLKRIMSCSMDFYDHDYDMMHLYGAWGRERQIERTSVSNITQQIDSRRGASSHVHNPFMALVSKNADETNGDAYGFSLVYSGNFICGTEVDRYGQMRAYMGINPFDFGWNLMPGDTFTSPEAVLVYSGNGIGEMSRKYHDLYRSRLRRGRYRDEFTPVLINNWEATYFDFNEEKILKFADKAKEAGVDMLVLDDGWFGARNNDTKGLGDWVANKEKLPDGIGGLAEKINKKGLKFGLWFEPEMVNPDSDLYRAHPDWCIHVKDRDRNPSRNQLILDLSRDDVCDYIVESVNAVLDSANISYVKWDMNRNMSDVGSAMLDREHQSEFYHRYILGLYKVFDRIVDTHPEILFEGCAGGGGRFDPGMLYYMSQIWTSDDTDAVERLFIQEGTSLVYPTCTMGAHVSECPNHQVQRTTPVKMRADVAMAGQFGFEVDLNEFTEEELEVTKESIAKYKSIRHIVHNGDMYRLKSPYNSDIVAWEFVSKDKKEVVFMRYIVKAQASPTWTTIKLQGLDEKAVYVDKETGAQYGGDMLMNCGLRYVNNKDYDSHVMVLERK